MKINNVLEKIIGFILLSPAVYSLFIFWYYHLVSVPSESLANRYHQWFGELIMYRTDQTNTSVIYFGLMAIAGVYLIKEKKL